MKLSAGNISFERIGLGRGLSYNAVSSIAQDSLGIIWFGTRYGLNRYDGNSITVYYADRNKSNSLPEDQIKRLKASGSKLWIQTFGAISCFDIITEKFDNHIVPGIKSFELGDGFTWIGTNNGLLRMDNQSGEISPVETGLPKGTLLNVLLDTDKGLMAGTNNGVYLLTEHNTPQIILPRVNTTNMYRDSDGDIWVGSTSNGVFCVSPGGDIRQYTESEDMVSSNFVRCIAEDLDGYIWIGTLLGLDHFDKKAGKVINHYGYEENDPTQLSHNSVWALYTDKQGAIWVGTYFGGINVFNPTSSVFRYYPVNPNHKGLNFRIVSQICEDSHDGLWICTEGGGLNYYNRKTSAFTYYNHDPSNPSSIPCNNVKSVANQGDTILWVATHTGGLNMFDIRKQKFTSLRNRPSHRSLIHSNNVGQIIPYNNRYIIATHNGVMLFDPSTLDVERLLPEQYHRRMNNNILAVMLTPEDDVWIGSEFEGLARYNMRTGEFKMYSYEATNITGISGNLINSITADRFGRVWIASPSGLDLYRPETDDFEHFSVADGLPGNIVLNVADSRYDDLLITTNQGFSVFNYTRKHFVNYIRENGLLLNEINQNGLFEASNGEIFIGGFNGMISFFERDLPGTTPAERIEITELRVNGKPVSPSDDTGILDASIMITDRINLGPEHNSFSFSFSDMGLTRSSKRKLVYKLEGYDRDWIKADIRNQASYTNVSPGDYTFVVGYESDAGTGIGKTHLSVHVNPPFYKTSWAIALYSLIAVLIIAFLNRMYLLLKRAEYELSIKDFEHKREAEYSQSKLRFFTNVSHEFRTPLTLIAGQLEYLLEKSNIAPSYYKRILSSYKNTRRMQAMINELLDFRKQENGYINLQVAEEDFNAFLYEIFVSYIELADSSNIKYEYDGPSNPVYLWFDRRLMEKVFYNLISNAFKFTDPKGSVSVTLRETNQTISVEVRDSGVGISTESIDKIFDRFYQAENSFGRKKNIMPGTGLGLALAKNIVEAHSGKIEVESRENEGSVFTVSLQKGDGFFTEEQKSLLKDDPETNIIESRDELKTVHEDIAATSTQKKYSILIVEDNEEMREFLRDLFLPLYNIETAADSFEGLSKATELQPDLVLSDVMMPGMSGTEMCVKLKNNFDTSHIPVVLLTARTATEHKVEGLQTGADDYITKPFSIKLLIVRIENVIKNRQALQEKYAKDRLAPAKLPFNDIDAQFIEKASRYVMDNIENPNYSVDSLASDMCLGRTSLFSKIKGVTGQTPNNFIQTIRLKYAAEIMQADPSVFVAEVAYRCGFSSQQYFSTSFKKFYGVSPAQYYRKK
ncbi:hybrid sensor histidine kinase/response regulator transcription factor [Dysgonomonas sp. 511]|uniref:hybrid sensor histidine kinase/response regulator transcription factor n=1 Tax=Dysgonomonas sp. 511 TaxID=2302930 RepID=UPI0013D24B4A|nr:hybrid sensor histidine kinase/response regulator transcription factor [Dysgonomonas sp. 511]